MYNEVNTIIAKARYTTSLPTLISDFYYWSVLTGLVFGKGISFYSSSGYNFSFKRNSLNMGRGEREKRDTFPVSNKG